MNINERLTEVDEIFDNIVDKYKPFNDTDSRKYYHSKDVAKISMNLYKSMNAQKRLIMYIIALFHDIGRFEENIAFNGIRDNNKFDHALQSVLIIKENDEIKNYLLKNSLYENRKDIFDSIYYHNKLIGDIECDCDYLKILRDADKISILQLVESEDIMSLNLKQKFSNNNLDDFYNKGCINNMNIVTDSDKLLKYVSFIYDVNSREAFFTIKTLVSKILDKVKSYNNDLIADDLEKIYCCIKSYFEVVREEE